ncbi:MAG TPA: hypothetical protein VIL32_14295 [Steroidobacteraceae bacterium]
MTLSGIGDIQSRSKPMRLLHLVARCGNTAGPPKNVFPALRAAVDLGVRFIEMEAAMSPDGTPLLSDALLLLRQRPEVTAFVNISRATLLRFGHDQVIANVLSALRPVQSRCIMISTELPAVYRGRLLTRCPTGWILPSYDPHVRLKYEALRPDYLFCDVDHLPPSGTLPRGPWHWVIYDVATLDVALELAERGASFIGTRHVYEMSEVIRAHATQATQARQAVQA